MGALGMLVLIGLVVLASWPERRPRYRGIPGRGRMWGDAAREQEAHLNHFFPPTEDDS